MRLVIGVFVGANLGFGVHDTVIGRNGWAIVWLILAAMWLQMYRVTD